MVLETMSQVVWVYRPAAPIVSQTMVFLGFIGQFHKFMDFFNICCYLHHLVSMSLVFVAIFEQRFTSPVVRQNPIKLKLVWGKRHCHVLLCSNIQCASFAIFRTMDGRPVVWTDGRTGGRADQR